MKSVEKIGRAIQARGEYLYYIYDELANEIGSEASEKILRRAIRRYGQNLGRRMGPLTDADDFLKKLESGNPPQIFNREFQERGAHESLMRLNHCPLVESWRTLDCSSEEISLLCSIAMEGDFGIFDNQPVHMTLESCLGDGDECCLMRIKKKEHCPGK